MTDPKSPPVAIIGVGTLFPGSQDAHGFWRDILDAKDLISDVPEDRWLIDDFYDADKSAPDKTYGKRGGFLDATGFDPMAFGIPPKVIEATDTSQLLALIVAQQVLQDAWGSQFQEIDKSRMSVVLGVAAGQELMNEMANRLQRPIWVKSLRELGYSEDEVQEAADRISAHYTPWQENTFPGLLGNVVAGRIANRFDFGGTNCVTDAACASSLSAISLGLNELYLGHSDVVIAGGVDTFNDIFMYMCFSKTPALSPTGDCRPFSKAADGTILGEGLAMFALKLLDNAERDGDQIYGVIRGSGSSSDGKGKAIYAPDADGQCRAVLRAYARAGYAPESVDLIEAHGTGTKAGDAAEFGGLRKAFSAAGKNQIALGSVKSQIGHTKSTAGAAGLFKVLMALHHRVLPPTLKVDEPSEKLGIKDSPFYINTQSRPWINTHDHPRRAGVSAFGFGGSNFHLTVEEYVEGKGKGRRAPYTRRDESELFLYSASTEAALSASLESHRGLDFANEGKESRQKFSPQKTYRAAILATSFEDLKKKTHQLLSEILASNGKSEYQYKTPNGIFFRVGGSAPAKKNIAFLFPGQGSQSVNMGSDWLTAFPQMPDFFPASLAAEKMDEARLIDVVFPQPRFNEDDKREDQARIRSTQWAQPALGLVSMAFAQLMGALGVEAGRFAGHSYGELTALWAAGCLSSKDLLALSRKRGMLMNEAAKNDGAMTALSCDIEKVNNLVKTHKVVVANHNAKNQVVVSGITSEIEAFEASLADAGVGFKRLNVATAFHSAVVAQAVEPFTTFASSINFKKAKGEVYSNVLAGPYGRKNKAKLLGEQIISPVRWVEMIEKMVEDGTTLFIECGPKTVLSKLTQRIVGKDASVVGLDHKRKHPWMSLWTAIAEFSTLGMEIDFSLLHAFETTPVRPKSKMQVSLSGANHNKPYPPKGGSAALPKPNVKKKEKKIVSNDTPKKPNGIAHPPTQPQNPAPQMAPQVPYWILAFQESQRQMAQAHAAYQQSMAQAHTVFLNVLAQSQASMAAMAGQQSYQPFPPPVHVQTAPMPVQASHPFPAPPAFAAPAPQYAHTSPAPNGNGAMNGHANTANGYANGHAFTAGHRASPYSNGHLNGQVKAVPTPVVAPQEVVNSAPSSSVPTLSIESLLLTVIADKTGYPVESLNGDMHLESDLGIDSIKRVEILSAITEQAAGLEDVDPAEMSEISTIGGILDFLQKDASPVQTTVSFEDALLEIVADKTGYPSDMLNLDMKLETDLGIDSIKRVEILSALSEKLPSLGDLDGSEMADLSTLGDIVSHVQDLGKK